MKPRSLLRLLPLLLFSLLLTACEVESAFARRAYLQMEVEPEHARVEIDERPSVSARLIREEPVELSVGKHTITIRADGYFPHDLLLDLPSGLTKVEVKLRELPPWAPGCYVLEHA